MEPALKVATDSRVRVVPHRMHMVSVSVCDIHLPTSTLKGAWFCRHQRPLNSSSSCSPLQNAACCLPSLLLQWRPELLGCSRSQTHTLISRRVSHNPPCSLARMQRPSTTLAVLRRQEVSFCKPSSGTLTPDSRRRVSCSQKTVGPSMVFGPITVMGVLNHFFFDPFSDCGQW